MPKSLADLLSGVNEITSIVVGGRDGVVKEAINEPNAETLAAIMGFALNMFDRNGELFGLGFTRHAVIKHGAAASMMIPMDDTVLSAHVRDASTVPTVERKLGGVLFGKP